MRLLAIAALLAGSACTDRTAVIDSDAGLVIFTSVPPMAWLAEQIAGERAAVHALLDATQDPHHFEPSPRKATELALADVYFSLGLPFEKANLSRIAAAMPALELIVLKHASGAASGEHAHSSLHPWTSPLGAREMAQQMQRALCRIDAENCAHYRQNYRQLASELDALHAELKRVLRPLAGGEFFVVHPAWADFARAYRLHQVALEHEGKQPGARHLAQTIDRALGAEATAILVQPQFSRRRAQVIADAVGAELVTLDPLKCELPDTLRQVASTLKKHMTRP